MLDIKENSITNIPASGSWPESIHVWEKEVLLAVNTALTAERPLLVRGEPGIGKSQIARAAAEELGRMFISEVVHARSESQDLQFSFDAVRRLGEAQAIGASRSQILDRLDAGKFISPGPLWWCFNWKSASAQADQCLCGSSRPEVPEDWCPAKGSVLLLDEIDKADADLPNGLLETLGNGAFMIPHITKAIRLETGAPPPLVIITTNEEREMPAAFLRRCMVLQMKLPRTQDDFIQYLVKRGKTHFKQACSKPVRVEAARQLWEDRQTAVENNLPAPGQAEYLDILRALIKMGKDETTRLEYLKAIKAFAFKKYPDEIR